MESLIDNFFQVLLLLFLINQFWQLIKLVGQFKSTWNSSVVWLFLIFTSVITIAVLKGFPNQLESTLGHLTLQNRMHLEKLHNALIGLGMFCGLAIMSLGVVEEVTLKKVKTLWRLPLIGVLLGLYCEGNQLAAILLLIELSIWIVLIIKRERFPFYFRTNIKSMTALLFCMLAWTITPEKKWLLMVLFCVYYYYRLIFLQTVLIKQWSEKQYTVDRQKR